MNINLLAFMNNRQHHLIKRFQQTFGRRLIREAVRLTWGQAHQTALGLGEFATDLVFRQSQHARCQSRQTGQTDRMVFAAHPGGAQRQRAAFQARTIPFNQVFVAIGFNCQRQLDLLNVLPHQRILP